MTHPIPTPTPDSRQTDARDAVRDMLYRIGRDHREAMMCIGTDLCDDILVRMAEDVAAAYEWNTLIRRDDDPAWIQH
jgi:hypothetical protein